MPSWRVHQGWLLPPMVGNEIAPVAQLDRVLASEARGRGFKSRRARQNENPAACGVLNLGFSHRYSTHDTE